MKKTILLLTLCLVCLSGCAFIREIIGEIFGPSPTPTPTPMPSPTATPVDPNILISETLRNNRTVGAYSNMAFTADGFLGSGGWWYLRYTIPTTSRGYIEFDARGFQQNEGEEFEGDLLTMWNADEGLEYETTTFLYELQKRGKLSAAYAANSLRVRMIVNKAWYIGDYKILEWNPAQTYHFRIEWGNGITTVYRSGMLVNRLQYVGEFSPRRHVIQIGSNSESRRKREAPHNILISNVVIGKR